MFRRQFARQVVVIFLITACLRFSPEIYWKTFVLVSEIFDWLLFNEFSWLRWLQPTLHFHNIPCSEAQTHGPWLRWATGLSRCHIQGHSKLATPSHLLQRMQRNPMCPKHQKCQNIDWKYSKRFSPTTSPPLAKLILGMSCRATTSFVSNDLISKHRDDMLSETLLPANSMHGDALTHCWTFLSICRFFGVLVFIASQTRWIHSLYQFEIINKIKSETLNQGQEGANDRKPSRINLIRLFLSFSTPFKLTWPLAIAFESLKLSSKRKLQCSRYT